MTRPARIVRLARFEAVGAASAWQWLVVGVIFAVGSWSATDGLQYPVGDAAEPPRASGWDVPVALATGNTGLGLVFGLAFLFLIADLYGRDTGADARLFVIVRARDRIDWWAGKLLALGVLAVVFSGLGVLVSCAVGVAQLGPDPSLSELGAIPVGEPGALAPRPGELAGPALAVVVAGAAALGLWAFGAVILAAAAWLERAALVFAAGAAWVLAEVAVASIVNQRYDVSRFDPLYHVSYAIHYGEGVLVETSWWTSVAVLLGALAVALVSGSIRLRSKSW